MSTDERLQALESSVEALQGVFAVDPEVTSQLLVFWFGVFVAGYAAGMIVRWLGKR